MATFAVLPPSATKLGEQVAYSWTCKHTDPAEHTIRCLWVWHWCGHSIWHAKAATDPTMQVEYIPEPGWMPTGVGAHDLIAVEPLHIEASVYWPECCGLHGWIRDGR